MQVFKSEIEEARKLGQELNVKEGIKAFISKVPLQGDVFWQNMSVDEAKEALGMLGSLSQEYLWSIVKTWNLQGKTAASTAFIRKTFSPRLKF